MSASAAGSSSSHNLPATGGEWPGSARFAGVMSRLGPAKLAAAGILIYLVVFLLAPVRIAVPFSTGAFWYLVVCYLMFFAGCSFLQLLPVSLVSFRERTNWSIDRLFNVVLGVALLGIALRLIDRFLFRGLDLSVDVLERRAMVATVGTNPVAMVSAILFPFSYLVLFVHLLRDPARRRRGPFLFSLLIFFMPAADGFLLGSRSVAVVGALLLFLFLVYFEVVKPRWRHILLSILIGLAGLGLGGWIFAVRLSAMQLSILQTIFDSGYAYTVTPVPWIVSLMSTTTSSLLYGLLFTYLHSSQYYTHGVFEFFYLYDHFSGPFGLGSDLFGNYFRVVGLLFGFPVNPAEGPRVGVFTTFFGDVYLDFGWWGPFFIFLLGAMVEKVWNSAKNGNLGSVPLYFYFVIIMLFFPVVNLLSNGQGLFAITSFVLFQFIYSYWFRERVTAEP